MIDLHMHSTYSDGQYTPMQLLNMAKKSNLSLMSITDHDTIDGMKESLEIAGRYGIPFISGIEISADFENEMHILGYGIDIGSESLKNKCEKFAVMREERSLRIIDYLRGYGIDISIDDVKAVSGNQVIGRPHFAQIMLKKGYISNIREAFDKYLDTPDFNLIERQKPSPEEGINIIHDAGGIAVLAHPISLKFNGNKLEELLKKLISYGLDGIETYYSAHTNKQIKEYHTLAEKYKLLETCGSDFHGEKIKPKNSIGRRICDNELLVDAKKEKIIYNNIKAILRN